MVVHYGLSADTSNSMKAPTKNISLYETTEDTSSYKNFFQMFMQ